MSGIKRVGVVVAIALSALVANAASAATIVNGSFEQSGPGVTPGSNYVTVYGGDTTSITGWKVTSGSVDFIGGYWQPSDGSNSLDMGGSGEGAIEQLIATVIGQSYTVGFDLAGNPTGEVKLLGVQATGAAQQTFSFDTAGFSTTSMGWSHRSYSFTATSASTALTFSALSGGASGPALDNVSIANGASGVGAVPELATWTMMILGFGMVGGSIRVAKRRSDRKFDAKIKGIMEGVNA